VREVGGVAAVFFDPMARRAMSVFVKTERRDLDLAALERDRAAGVEAAAGRRIDRRGDVAAEDDAPAAALGIGVGDGDRGKQCLRVGVQRVGVESAISTILPTYITATRLEI
jgi:hypothetical protein